jgi:hypothetical protein
MPDVLVAAVHQPEVLWSLVATAPLFLTALEQVQAQGCTFTLDADSFQVIAQQAHLVGLHLMHSSRPTQHLGIDLFCTVDTLQSSVTAVQYLMSTSLDDALDVRSVVLTQASLEPVFIQTRNGLTTDPGPHLQYDPKLVAGYYNNYRDGLVWWNSWLCWLTRLAPSECNLKSDKTAYGCLHIPDREPYVTQAPPAAARTQIYFNADTWAVASQPNMAALDHTVLQNSIGNQQYQNKVTSNTAILWPNTNTSWYSMPLGICYTVWAQVGPKPVTGDFSTGWIQNTQAGVITTTQISLPADWSTVYFPVIKYAAANSTFPNSTQINIDWIRNDGFVRSHGYMDLNDIPDGASYNDFASIKK